jgi:hypothetical protein
MEIFNFFENILMDWIYIYIHKNKNNWFVFDVEWKDYCA